jgi:hypothetical protein
MNILPWRNHRSSKTTMVKETTTMVVVEAEEANMDSVVEVEVVDDHIVSIVGKMITSAQIAL